MDPEKIAHWQAADAVFDQWLDLPDAEREQWLATQPLPEPVRRRLVQLITAHERPRASLDPAGSDLAGCVLGDWTLDTELGRGGMAVVYRAWREEGMARQQAAVKILTLGALGATGRERFQREATILARLNHPNVTALIDSGVADDGTCWLAMPLVDGKRIDRWCDANSLDARAIVRLYLQVCGAAAYAHRNLVIHRDIKPSNVLVNDNAHVHLLDFGIGQFTDAQDERTRTMWRALTPGYAAPEQLTGAPPSTAMDVYGLGALLHRLLTGRTPQVTTEDTDTTRPSLLVRDADDVYHRHYVPLKNDLDRVLLKALSEEPEKRYATAEALADDLRRWLDGRPVLAQKPKLGYRMRKFVTRNKVGVAASVLLAASLAGGVAATLWQANEARRSAELAEQEAANARTHAQRAVLVRDFLAHVFESTEPASGGVPTALELLDEGARRARSDVLDTDPLAAADILMLTGKARLILNQIDEGQADLEKAHELFATGNRQAHAERSIIESELSSVMRFRGISELAVQKARVAVALGELAWEESGDAEPLIGARIRLAEAMYTRNSHAATALLEEVVKSLPTYGLENTGLHLSALSSLSITARDAAPNDHEMHITRAEALIEMSSRIHGADSGAHASILANQSLSFLKAGNHERGEQLAFAAAELADRIYKQPHSARALAHCTLALFLRRGGRPAEALEHYSIVSEIYASIDKGDMTAATCYRASGYTYMITGDYDTALVNLEQSWEILGELGLHSSTSGFNTCGLMATTRLRTNDIGGATQTLAGCPFNNDTKVVSLTRMQAQAELHFARGEFGEAASVATEARREGPPKADDSSWTRPWMLSLLLARRMGQDETWAKLQSELGPHAAMEPLLHCLAEPNETNCLAVP